MQVFQRAGMVWASMTRIVLVLLFLSNSVDLRGDEPTFLNTKVFTAQDTLLCDQDADEDTRECLAGLVWPPTQFEVRCEAPLPQFGDALVSFPSPLTSGDPTNDRVTMEWYLARDKENEPIECAGGRRRSRIGF